MTFKALLYLQNLHAGVSRHLLGEASNQYELSTIPYITLLILFLSSQGDLLFNIYSQAVLNWD